MYIYVLHVFLAQEAEVIGYLGNQSADGCKLPWECWAFNPDLLLKEQLLITEPSLQVHEKFLRSIFKNNLTNQLL